MTAEIRFSFHYLFWILVLVNYDLPKIWRTECARITKHKQTSFLIAVVKMFVNPLGK